MKTAVLLLMFCLPAVAQIPEATDYVDRTVMLVSHDPGSEGIVPMLIPSDGGKKLAFISVSKIKGAINVGGTPIRLGDLPSILAGSTEEISKLLAENIRLRTENERLWKVAMKDTPKAETVVVQQPAPNVPTQSEIRIQQQIDENARRQQNLQNWLMLQKANRPQSINLNYSDCTKLPALCAGR